MARQDRTATHALTLLRDLEREPYRYDFFDVLRRLECLYADRPRLGRSTRLADDPIRLGEEPSMAFAAATLAKLQPPSGNRPSRLLVSFFGLFGPNGPLPLHLTEYARDRERNAGDPTFARFADMFHHRLLALFYRAWADAQPAVQYDRPESDRFAAYVGSLFGLGVAEARDRDALPDHAKLHFAGHFACQTRNADGLQAIIEAFFRIPAEIEPFLGHWMQLPEDSRCRLGASPETGTLGVNATIGARVWDCQSKFRIILGPMSFADFSRLLPGGESLPRLVALVRNYLGDELDWDANLILRKEDVPETCLGRAGTLGRTTWIKSRPFTHDARDLTLNALTS